VLWLGLLVSGALVAAPAIAGTGADIHAAEKAVAARMPGGGRQFFSSVYETKAAVCGVVTSGGGDQRFLVAVTKTAAGKPSLGEVLLDAPGGPTVTGKDGEVLPLFDVRWAAECVGP
jgi:hypothetical protein